MPDIAESAVRTFVDTVTPDIRRDPRAALMDISVKGALRDAIAEGAAASNGALSDVSEKDRYDFSENPAQREYSMLDGGVVRVAVIQIPSWIADDGAHIGALDETRYLFRNMSVRVLSEGVDVPTKGLSRLFENWRREDDIDATFVPWRYVSEFTSGQYGLSDLFDLAKVPELISEQKLRFTKDLLNAIGDAFRDRSEVDSFVYLKFQMKLANIVPDRAVLEEVLLALWRWAEKEGHGRRLLLELKELKKENTQLVKLINDALSGKAATV